MASQKYIDLSLDLAVKLTPPDDETRDILAELNDRVSVSLAEQSRFQEWCDRADALYYAERFTLGGADLWPDDPSAVTPGRAHVSVNLPALYVEVPAALQSVQPIENMVATDTTDEAREAAAALERVYFAWKREIDFELLMHRAAIVKALYGRTAARIFWDPERRLPVVEIIEQPRNLYLGWRSDRYDELEWAAYVTKMDPNSVAAEFGLDVQARDAGSGTVTPWIPPGVGTPNVLFQQSPARPYLNFGPAKIEVWDYWYRRPRIVGGRVRGAETYNIVVVGNQIARGPTKYPEYDGNLPYIPIFNTFIPGMPNGRPELLDLEHLIREKMEKITAGSQMIASAVSGDYYQLVGPEAPPRVPAGLRPRRNEIVAPGPGNRIDIIPASTPEIQLEQYLARIDRELASISGLNDLLLGLAPSAALNSSKAINALIANYEARLSMRRDLFYRFRRQVWELAKAIWRAKDATVRDIISAGDAYLDIRPPGLEPRDDFETANRVINLLNAKLISQRRAMDMVGVDDPETEQDLIREERTDASLFPADVQAMAQLMAILRQLGLAQSPEGAGAPTPGGTRETLREAARSATPTNATSTQQPGEVGMPPAEAQPMLAQSMLAGGQVKSRILSQVQIPPEGGG